MAFKTTQDKLTLLQNGGTSGQDLNVDSAIVAGYTGNGVKVAIVDDGLEIAHEDF